jgi:hypothetical protein
MTLAQTIVSDVVTLRERSVSAPLSFETYLLTFIKEGNIRAYWYDTSSPTSRRVLIDNTGCCCCDCERYRPNRWRKPQLDRFGIMVSRCRKANVVPGTDIGNTRRWIFRLNLPLTAMSTVAVFYFMPLKPVEGSWLVKIKMVDFFGCALTLAASTLIVVSLCLKSEVTFNEQFS